MIFFFGRNIIKYNKGESNMQNNVITEIDWMRLMNSGQSNIRKIMGTCSVRRL